MSGAVDALVVGGGPAGAAFSAELARRGYEPLVLERARFPRPKPCGESVNAGAMGALRRMGMLDAVRAANPAPIRQWRLVGGGREVRARSPGGIGIERSIFDATLVGTVRARGVRVIEECRVTGVTRRAGGWDVDAVRRGRGIRLRSRLLVGADGLRSVVSRRLGLIGRAARRYKISFTFRVRGVGPPRHVGQLLLEGGVTIGLAPVHGDDGLWNATVVFDITGRGVRGQDLNARGRRAIARAPFGWKDAPWIVAGPWTSGPFDRPVRSMVDEGVLLVGDAAGYFDPLTGQGIYRALRSAELGAATAAEGLAADDVGVRALAEYERRWRRELRGPRAFQHVADRLLRHRLSRHAVLSLMAQWSGLADRVIGVSGDHLPVRSLLGAGPAYPSPARP